ncbi:surface carbohydrate biosynthesis protein [Roseivirga sp. E12]|uniref:surface carbohydrate biosynthesis protein n=1 Tax=Roseivirga sp. E12 TaxID=2819237 RepID=UPI001ABC3024|nr:surface carbohydrate biosynthesis protein [Roseivirga sp. E12]MBO3698374.1 hypothetical protein [Roseivirga sp. E12]
MKKRYLIIAVEVKVRDYLSRLLLVKKALENGFIVIFGSERTLSIHRDKLPKGVYFDKSISLNKKDQFAELLSKGSQIVSLDEEGLASQNNRFKYVTQRVSPETLEQASLVFTWGKSEEETILSEYPEYAHKVKATGNPRVDLLKPKLAQKIFAKDISRIKAKYGDFVFFPSNFTVNHALGKGGPMKLLTNIGRIKNKSDELHYTDKLDYFERMFHYFAHLVEETAIKFPELNVLVRPHPSEDPGFWRAMSEKYKNLHVQDGGPPTPWLMASSFVIHSSCTTGLEAKLLGRDVLAYLPDTSHEYAKHISNDFSIVCHKKEEVLQILERHIQKDDWSGLINDKTSRAFEKHIANYGAEDDASEQIMKHIIELEEVRTDDSFDEIQVSWKQKVYMWLVKFKLKPSTEFYNTRKFPGLGKRELRRDLSRMVSDSEMESIRINSKGLNLFEIFTEN